LGRTPLHYACLYEHLEGILCLLEHGADANIKNNVSTATRGVAVMVEMVGCGGEG
jgi:ankyrin repeat protein